MTPTEQDKELREQVAKICGYERQEQHSSEKIKWYEIDEYGNPINVTRKVDHLVQLITADRKRVALEARIDELELLPIHTFTNSPLLHCGITAQERIERIAELEKERKQ